MIEETWLIPSIAAGAESGGLAIDIGANVGGVTDLLAENFDAVLAVEPDPRAFHGLLQTAAARTNVLCHHGAATSKNGAVDILLRPDSVQSSLLEDHPVGAGDQLPSPVVGRVGVNGNTLDFLLFVARQRFPAAPLTFIKVDVEGAEADVLAGATDPAFSQVKWLIEVHDREVEVGLQLQRLGYENIEIIPHPHPGAHPKHFWVYAEPTNAHQAS